MRSPTAGARCRRPRRATGAGCSPPRPCATRFSASMRCSPNGAPASIPPIELAAAHLKLAWWREEIERLGRGAPVHPISRYIASLAARGRGGFHAPRDNPRGRRAPDRRRTARAWRRARSARGRPVGGAARDGSAPRGRAGADAGAAAVHRAEAALAAAEYLNDAIAGYRRAARFGRVVFPVDELLAANVEDADLSAAEPPLHLQSYLEELRRRAVGYCSQATAALPRSEHGPMRHLLVLAALGARQSEWPAERAAASARAVSRLEHGAPRCAPAMSGASMEPLAIPTAKQLPAKLEPRRPLGADDSRHRSERRLRAGARNRLRARGRERRARRPQRRQARPAVR